MNLRSRRVAGAVLVLVLACGAVALEAQPESPAMRVDPDRPPFPETPGSRLHMLLEKTVFQVNVLTLDVRVDPGTASHLGRILEAADLAGAARSDSLAHTVMEAPQAWVRMEFHRSVSQDRFFRGIRKNLEMAHRAGIITVGHRDRVVGQLPEWYDFLATRGVKSGDVLVYWIHADSLETAYRGVEGRPLFSSAEGDSEARYGVLGSYLAPGSDFRVGLLGSLTRAR